MSLTGNLGSLRINQQTSIYDAKVDHRKRLVSEISLTKLIGYNLFREDSGCTILRCEAGDGAAVIEEAIDFLSVLNSHLLLFELSTETGIN